MNTEKDDAITQHIVNSHIDTSSTATNTSSSSMETPEVSAADRLLSLPRVPKSKQQELKIAELQAMLQARVEMIQNQVLHIMTSESLTQPFPATPTYIDGMMTKLQLLQTEMQQKEKEFRDTLRYLGTQRMHTPRLPIETPGPHRLQAKTPRQQEMELQQKIDLQNQAEADLHTPANTTDTHLVEVFKQLTQVMKESNTSDTTEPAHFNGSDERWDEFYSQLRTYLSAKNWLTTFEHKEGPGAVGFNNEINKKLYNKLLMLCKNGHAVTYIKKAAEFDGHGAGRQLLLRYDGHSKQRQKTLKKAIEQLRQVNGTNITRHIDLFRRYCQYLILHACMHSTVKMYQSTNTGRNSLTTSPT
jgi:hypothetical protein